MARCDGDNRQEGVVVEEKDAGEGYKGWIEWSRDNKIATIRTIAVFGCRRTIVG